MNLRKSPEEKLQVAVCSHLRQTLPDSAIYFAIPNGGFRRASEARRLKKTGTLAGVPDIAICWRGKILFIELKSEHGRLSDNQLRTHRQLYEAGFQTFVCRSVEEVEQALAEAGVPKRLPSIIDLPDFAA